MRAINQCTQYLWCMLPPPASNPNLYASSQEIQEPTNQTARFLCVLWTHKMNWDSFESKNGRLASHDFRPGLQSIRAVTGRTGRFRSRDNSVCANFNHLDPAQYCDWDPAHLHFLPSKCIEYLQQGQLSKRLTLKFSFVYMWWSFCPMAFTTNGECHSWYPASNIRKVPKKSGCWKNAVGYAAYCTQPPWKGPSPLLLTHIGANPLTGSYFIHHRRRQFVRQSRLGGGINPRDGFATAHILPFFSTFCLTFPQLFRSRVLWAGKRGMTRLRAIIREDARSGLFLTSCTSWEFLYRGRQEQLSLFNPTNNFEKVNIVLDSTR